MSENAKESIAFYQRLLCTPNIDTQTIRMANENIQRLMIADANVKSQLVVFLDVNNT